MYLVYPGIISKPAASSELWTPANASPWGWWDFGDNANTTIVSNAFSQVNDKSGNGRFVTQLTVPNRPTVSTLNGLNVASFNGTSHRLVRTGLPTTANFTRYHVFALVNYTGLSTASPGSRIISLSAGLNDTDTNGFIPVFRRSGEANIGSNIGGTTITSSASFNLSTWFVAEAFHTGTNASVLVNAGTTNSASNNFGSRTINSVFLGSNAGQNAGFWNGLFAEILIFNSQQSTDISQKVQGYLFHRRGLQESLPVAHPYRNNPPTV